MLFYAGRAAEGAAILRRAQERVPAGEPAREQLEVVARERGAALTIVAISGLRALFGVRRGDLPAAQADA